MIWPFSLLLPRKQRVLNKINNLTQKLNNLDRINRGYRAELNEKSRSIDSKDESIKRQSRFALWGRRREQYRLEQRRFRLNREINRLRNEYSRL